MKSPENDNCRVHRPCALAAVSREAGCCGGGGSGGGGGTCLVGTRSCQMCCRAVVQRVCCM